VASEGGPASPRDEAPHVSVPRLPDWTDSWEDAPGTASASASPIRLPHTASYSRLILRSAHRLLRESSEAHRSHGHPQGAPHGHLMRSLELTSGVTSGPSAHLNPLKGPVHAALLSRGRHRGGERAPTGCCWSSPPSGRMRSALTAATSPLGASSSLLRAGAGTTEGRGRAAPGGRVRSLEQSQSAPELRYRPVGAAALSRSDFSSPFRSGARLVRSAHGLGPVRDAHEPGSWSTLRRNPATFARTCTAELFKGPIGGRPL
jgi:hypothetical protein